MRNMAGHPSKMGGFEIPRAQEKPPESLLRLIWPDLDKWHGRFGPGQAQIKDMAANGFTELLFYLREVILQDSVTLKERFPLSPVWNHRVFHHPDYPIYAAKVRQLSQEEKPIREATDRPPRSNQGPGLRSVSKGASRSYEGSDRQYGWANPGSGRPTYTGQIYRYPEYPVSWDQGHGSNGNNTYTNSSNKIRKIPETS
jgi:hypothetical protein